MDTDMPPPPVPQMLDLTGLPEPLVRMVVEVVQAANLRDDLAGVVVRGDALSQRPERLAGLHGCQLDHRGG